MVNVRQMLVASKNYKIKCPNPLVPEGWCVHNTYNDASANNEVQYMILNHNEVSFHVAVDDKETVQGLPYDRNAWAAGDGGKGPGNRKYLHLEICYSKSGGDRYTKAEQNAVKFLAQDLKKRGWGINKIKKHQDFSGKYCPHRILDEGRWQSFLNRVQEELNVLNKPAPKPVVPVQGIGTLKVLENTVIRDKPVYLGNITGNVSPSEAYIVHDYQTGWFNVGGWVSAKHVQFIPHNDTKITR
jgi:N-acetylmuramoyl-L-alanine amidase